jgi:hypothetical protein
LPDGVTVEIKGLTQVARTLEQDLPEAMAKGAIRESLHAGGEVVAGAIESSAKGELAEDVAVVVHVTNQKNLSGYALIGPAYNPAARVVRKRGLYAGQPDPTSVPGVFDLFVEKGHGPPGVHRERQRAKRSGREIEFGNHETPPHPFMGPAFDSSKDEALSAMVDSLREGIAAAAKQVAKPLQK